MYIIGVHSLIHATGLAYVYSIYYTNVIDSVNDVSVSYM